MIWDMIVEGSGFQSFRPMLLNIEPGYTVDVVLPTARTVSRNVTATFHNVLNAVKPEI